MTKQDNVTEITFKPEELKSFFNQLATSLCAIKHNALTFSPWQVAGIKRNEVRNSAILSWILDPNGSHDLGKIPLSILLKSLTTENFSTTFHNYYYINMETNPTGNIANRVDIEIDADTFYLLIEVKIDAVHFL